MERRRSLVLSCAVLAACGARTELGAMDASAPDVHESETPPSIDAADHDADVASDAIDEFDREEAACTTCPKRAFVTSRVFQADLGGLAGADAKCQTLADAAHLGGTYMAWLSDDVASPASRFAHASVPYVRVDGVVIANDWNDLTDGTLAAPLDRTELGGLASAGTSCGAWSDTLQSGMNWSGYDYANCESWTSTTSWAALLGQIGATNWWWSIWCQADCSGTAPLYCFEQ